MARQHFLFPARLIEKLPGLRKLSWPLEALVIRALAGLMRLMSAERAGRFAYTVFGRLRSLFPFTAKIRRNLTLAFPEKDAQEIERLTAITCSNLGCAAAELVMADRIWVERGERIEFVMEDGVDFADYHHRAAVLVTGHIGAWQIATFVATQYDLRVTSVYAPEKNPYLQKVFLKLRSKLPCNWVSRDGCMRGLTKELRLGHIVGLVSDTRLDSGDPLSFFGIPTPTNTTAARLALRNHCDLLPVRAERLPGMKFRITLCRPLRPDNPDAPVAEQARQMTQSLLGHFETWIRESPEQWMCFGRRWPHAAYASLDNIKPTHA